MTRNILEERGLSRWLVGRFRRLIVASIPGIQIGENRLIAKRDGDGNQDPFWQRQDGSEINLTGSVKVARATATLTLTTSSQSIVGDGDSSKVRILLPDAADWIIVGVFDLEVSATDPNKLIGELFVNDSGSAETGVAVSGQGDILDVKTVMQVWKVTTTTVDVPVELKAKKQTDAGTATCRSGNTNIFAFSGAGGGEATVTSSDHGTQTGLGDPADHVWATLVDGSRAFTGEQSMGTNKLTDVVDPTADQDAATKKYTDGLAKQEVYIPFGSEPEAGVTIFPS